MVDLHCRRMGGSARPCARDAMQASTSGEPGHGHPTAPATILSRTRQPSSAGTAYRRAVRRAGTSRRPGRRRLLNLTVLTLQGLGTTPWLLGLGTALMGMGPALSGGPAEAWYVDTVHAHSGPGADVRTGLARGSSATSAALAVGTLLGGTVAWLLGLGPDFGARLSAATSGLVLPLSVPLLLGAAVEVAFLLYVLAALPEPPRPATPREVLRGIPVTVAGGLRLGWAAMRWSVGCSSVQGAAGSALAAIELLTPGRAAALTGASGSRPHLVCLRYPGSSASAGCTAGRVSGRGGRAHRCPRRSARTTLSAHPHRLDRPSPSAVPPAARPASVPAVYDAATGLMLLYVNSVLASVCPLPPTPRARPRSPHGAR